MPLCTNQQIWLMILYLRSPWLLTLISSMLLWYIANLEERLSKSLDKITKIMIAPKDKNDIDFEGIAKVFQLNDNVLADEWKYVKRGSIGRLF